MEKFDFDTIPDDKDPEGDIERREEEVKRIYEARKDEGVSAKLVRKAREILRSNEALIGEEDVFLYRRAGYSPEELHWIATVKRASEESPVGPHLNAYDLVRFHAMLAVDQKKYQGEMLSRVTEKYLEKILAEIVSVYRPTMRDPEHRALLNAPPPPGFEHLQRRRTPYEKEIVRLFDELDAEKDSMKRVVTLTRFLNLVHIGGNPEALAHLGGFPTSKNASAKEYQREAADFLTRLNNLGIKG